MRKSAAIRVTRTYLENRRRQGRIVIAEVSYESQVACAMGSDPYGGAGREIICFGITVNYETSVASPSSKCHPRSRNERLFAGVGAIHLGPLIENAPHSRFEGRGDSHTGQGKSDEGKERDHCGSWGVQAILKVGLYRIAKIEGILDLVRSIGEAGFKSAKFSEAKSAGSAKMKFRN